MLSLHALLEKAVQMNVSDIFIISGIALSGKCRGEVIRLDEEMVLPESSEELIHEVYALAKRDMGRLQRMGDDDFSFAVPGLSRFRTSTYKQRGSLAAVIRVISFGIPDYHTLHIPENVMSVSEKRSGLVLVSGSAGSGKSTTLACIIDRINETRSGHIITLEEPIEYLHRNKRSIVSQREIELDSLNYVTALRACLRQAPDVILVGEMRDYDTIQTAMTAAETGHLVISTLHTMGAVNTIDRIIDVFPPSQQQQIRFQLAMLLQAVISQQLVPSTDNQLVPAFEVMFLNTAIKNMIRESKIHQIDSMIASSAAEGMVSMDGSLLELVKQKLVLAETAQAACTNPETFAKKLAALG